MWDYQTFVIQSEESNCISSCQNIIIHSILQQRTELLEEVSLWKYQRNEYNNRFNLQFLIWHHLSMHVNFRTWNKQEIWILFFIATVEIWDLKQDWYLSFEIKKWFILAMIYFDRCTIDGKLIKLFYSLKCPIITV